MNISHLTPTFADIKTWVRAATVTVNHLITGKQDKADNLTALADDGYVALASYTVATLPTATAPVRLIYVSDEAGGAVPAFNDGTNWRRVTDRAVVS